MAKAKQAKKQDSQLSIAIRAALFTPVNVADQEIGEFIRSKSAQMVASWDNVFTSYPHADIVAALNPADKPERNSYAAKLLTNARVTFRLFEADAPAYRRTFVESSASWDDRLTAVREALAARAAVQAEAAIVGEEIARELAANPADVTGASERAKPAIERRLAELAAVRARVAEEKAAADMRKTIAKFDPVAAAHTFAEACERDEKRGLGWLAEYAAYLMDYVKGAAERKAQGAKMPVRDAEPIEV